MPQDPPGSPDLVKARNRLTAFLLDTPDAIQSVLAILALRVCPNTVSRHWNASQSSSNEPFTEETARQLTELVMTICHNQRFQDQERTLDTIRLIVQFNGLFLDYLNAIPGSDVRRQESKPQ